MHGDCENSGVSAEPVDASNLTHLKGTFTGPPDTVYAGGRYQVDIRIPDMYPFKPPIMKMDTKIWHPNVSSVTVSVYHSCATPGQSSRADCASLRRELSVWTHLALAGLLSARSRLY